ncbi:hypothetical protein B296_00007126 [Ensete ventricosum]|uniref:Uncharacterized protein n=1 Tax=Ensete ventricosum TaxID=4639 RepID=A0A426YU67_ENSVE|nr:hypothetical protein B296_00007126 [Ensete ventricosum]
MRTGHYWAVPPIGAVSTPLPPKIDRDRFWAVSAEGGRKKKREKKNLELDTALRLRDPLPAGDFFSPRGEKKRLPTWGEGMM